MEQWKGRLEIIKQKVVRGLEEFETSATSASAFSNFKVLLDMFISETHACMDKLLQEDVEEYTELQIRAKLATQKQEPSPTINVVKQGTVHSDNWVQSRLPKLELPKFYGDILKWNEFWDRFRSNVDSQRLCEADKLAYLQASLGQKALAAIEGLDVTDANYTVAVDILKGRFGRPELVVDAHYNAFFNIQKATSSPRNCIDTLNEIERHLRVLKALGEDINQNNLKTVIFNKCPEEIVYEVKNRIAHGKDSVEEVRKVIEQLLMSRMISWKPPTVEALHIRHNNKERNLASTRPSTFKGHAIKRKLLSDSPIKNKRARFQPCIFCNGEHFNDKCNLSLEERRKKLNNRCFKCFKSGHLANKCQGKIKCFHCKMAHNSALCGKVERVQKNDRNETQVNYSGSGGYTYLQTAIVTIEKEYKHYRCRALFDTGSQRSYITNTLMKNLKLNTLEQSSLTVYTFGSVKPQNVESAITEIRIIGFNTAVDIRVNVMPYITESIISPSVHGFTHHQNLPLADDGSLGSNIDLLIGNDYYHNFVKTGRIQCSPTLFMIESEFGWLLSGFQKEYKKENLTFITYTQEPSQAEDPSFDRPLKFNLVNKLWDLETIGIIDCPKASGDDQVVDEFNKTVKYEKGRYWINWPWRMVPPELPNNYGIAYGRLVGLLKRTKNSTLDKYEAVLQDQQKKGIIELINKTTPTKGPVHYLPHHGVPKGDSIRIVYDASSKSKGSNSLNECLYKGPLLLENLVGLIIRFRSHKYGILADVEKAFLQIGIQEIDRDVTRFLWVKDPKQKPSEENLLHFRFCRVPFGIVCSPFILAITVKHHLKKCNTTMSNRVARDLYVDNLVSGSDTREECTQLYKETKHIFKEISMNMREWWTNVPDLNLSTENYQLKKDKVMILGLTWCLETDTLSLNVENFSMRSPSPVTKRTILACVASMYDPCGFVTPLLIGPKLFLQGLWRQKFHWDTVLPENLHSKWAGLECHIKEVKDVKIPRFYGLIKSLRTNTTIEMHCFTDASSNAYAAAIYLKVVDNGTCNINLIMSKSRLKPIKENSKNTIPRLELLGMLIGCRLIKFTKAHIDLNINKTYLWSDSQVVLHWLNSKKVLPPFVSARVEEIRKSKDTKFRYVPTEFNTADLATRPFKGLIKNTDWFKGPPFLHQSEDKWPTCETVLNINVIEKEGNFIKELQRKHFPDEVGLKVTNLSRSLGLFMDDDGILRCKGRFKLANWPVDQKYPILLPKNNEFTDKIIKETHEELYHVGVSQTLAHIRLKYWVIHGRSQVQKVLRRCQPCQKHGGRPYKIPPIAPFPKERIIFSQPFTYTGTDYLGPLYIISKETQSIEKRWISLYTCLAVRAVHLEVVADLSAEECLLSLRKFVATRGKPKMILSDNAANYKLTADVCNSTGIKWKFIPELAPWFGGVYERLVALVKHCLKRTIDKHTLNDSQLAAVVKEVESILNCRPLTTVGAEIEHILTPADFLCQGSPLTVEVVENNILTKPNSEVKMNLIEGWKRGQIIFEEFKKMFVGQYLPTLRERYSVVRQPRVTHAASPQVGDVVQIKDDAPRIKWRVGKICELVESKDRVVRVAKVKVGDREYTRSVGHLYPLEIGDRDGRTTEEVRADVESQNVGEQGDQARENSNNGTEEDVRDSSEEKFGQRRSVRQAAVEAKRKISEWTQALFVSCNL